MISTERRGRRSRGGRRIEGGSHRDPVRHHIVLNDRVYDIIESERKAYETNNECLFRLLTEKTNRIRQLEKKVDALLDQIEEAPIKIIQRKDLEAPTQYEL